jgi:tetratricopeptide (TPR) repeat protein
MRSVGHFRWGATPACLFLSLLAASPIPVPARQSDSPAAVLGKIRSMAETQHEIVMLLIRKKEFDQAAAEASKIFDMNWPTNEEPVLLLELNILSRKFQEEHQESMAMRLLDLNSKAFKSAKSQIWIWKEKGYLFKKMGQDDKALECFQKAQRLEQGK